MYFQYNYRPSDTNVHWYSDWNSLIPQAKRRRFVSITQFSKLIRSFFRQPISRSNSQKASEPWLCGLNRVRWKMKIGIPCLALSGQVFWLPQFLIFFDFGGLASPNRMYYQRNFFYQNFRNLITFPKLAHLLRYSIGNPKNFAWTPKRMWKFAIFCPFFQIKRDITLRSASYKYKSGVQSEI
jgi:hypothetical protein